MRSSLQFATPKKTTLMMKHQKVLALGDEDRMDDVDGG